MQITLKQNEIERAVRQYIGKLGINPNDKQVSMEFTAGRGERGLVVEINIEEVGDLNDTPVGRGNSEVESTRAPRPQNRAAAAPTPTQPPAAEGDTGGDNTGFNVGGVFNGGPEGALATGPEATGTVVTPAGKSLFASD